MGKYDKDRFQKELAIRYCLARGAIPFLEVVVGSVSDLSDSTESLTDLDVVGIEGALDGALRRTIYDCKTTNKMSAINRAFWAAGVKDYTRCDEAVVILKSRAVNNHRLSALSVDVDLHDERSFTSLGQTADSAFPADTCYQASVERWNTLYDAYSTNEWSIELFGLARNAAPLTQAPWSVFRRVIAELRSAKGQVDPTKERHVAIFLDVLASVFVLWASMGRDIRRFYEPSMAKREFEDILRYYIWGGRDSYAIRQQMRERTGIENGTPSVELPAWGDLVKFAGLVLAAPQHVLECSLVCRELAIRSLVGGVASYDHALSSRFNSNPRIRQFSASLSDYLVAAGGLPKDLGKVVQAELFAN